MSCPPSSMRPSFPLQTRSLIPASALLLAVGLLLPSLAQASDRRFTYTYESPVVQKGTVELEPWFTASMGRDTYYFRLDQRLELEWGLAKGVQTAFYLNFRAQAHDEGGVLVKETAFRGFSNEWKFSLLDPVADPLGLGLYVEFGIQPHEVELEVKLLLDKAVGPALLAFNAVGEVEIKPQAAGQAPEIEGKLIFLFGTSFSLGPHFALGFELRELNVFAGGELKLALLSAGPALHVRGERVWATLTVLPQIVDLKSRTHRTDDAEWLETRLIFGIHL